MLIHAVSSLYRARIKYWLLVELIKIKQKPGWIIWIFFPLVWRDQNAYGRQGMQSTVILTCNVWHAVALAETIWCFLMQVPCLVWDATQSKLGTASRCDSLLADSCSGLAAMTWAQKPVRHFPGHNFWALHNRIGGGQVWWALTLSTYFPFSLCLCVMVRQG